MKPKKVTESDAKSYLNRTIDLKKKLNCLKDEQKDINETVSALEDKISKRLAAYKRLKSIAVEDKRSTRFDKEITDWCCDLEVLIKKVFGISFYNFVHSKFPEAIEVIKDVDEVIEDIEITLSVRCKRVKDVVKKTLRLFPRLIQWVPVLYEDWDWGFGSTIDIMEFKLKRLQDCLKDGYYKDKAEEISIALEHIKRYKEPEKYTIDYDLEVEEQPKTLKERRKRRKNFMGLYVCQVDKWGSPTLYGSNRREKVGEEESNRRHRIFLEQDKLSQWHWNQLWKLISKKGQMWLD